jgi:hypothetical protein
MTAPVPDPTMKSGVIYDDFQRGFGHDDPDLLVWRSTTAVMNPTITAARLAQQRRLDPVRFAREFEAEFADDVAAFVPRDWIDAAVRVGRFELPPNRSRRAVAAIDPSGGGLDAFTFAVVVQMPDGGLVQAVMKGEAWVGTLAPDLEGLVRDYMRTAKAYGCAEVISDRYAARWVRQAVERHGLRFVASEMTRSEAYLNVEPLLAQGRIELLDHPQLIRELAMLERRPQPGGKEVVEHPRGGHDDFANALALAAAHAWTQTPEKTLAVVMPEGDRYNPAHDPASPHFWQHRYFGGRPARDPIAALGFVPAPARATPSQALLDLRDANRRDDARWQAQLRAQQDHIRRLATQEKS